MSFVTSGECSHSHTTFFLSNHSPWDLSLITFLWQKDSQALKGAGYFRLQIKLGKTSDKDFGQKQYSEKKIKKKQHYLPLSVLSYEQDLKCLWLFAYEGKCQDPWIICWKLTLICGGFRQSHQNIHHSARRGSLWLFHYTFRSSVHCFRPKMTWRPFGRFILVCHCHSRPMPRNENTSKPSTHWTPPKWTLSDVHMSGKL